MKMNGWVQPRGKSTPQKIIIVKKKLSQTKQASAAHIFKQETDWCIPLYSKYMRPIFFIVILLIHTFK